MWKRREQNCPPLRTAAVNQLDEIVHPEDHTLKDTFSTGTPTSPHIRSKLAPTLGASKQGGLFAPGFHLLHQGHQQSLA